MNLYENIPERLEEEQIEILYQQPRCRIERIISYGQTTPENTWYDQEEEEIVVLLQGEAILSVEKAGTGWTGDRDKAVNEAVNEDANMDVNGDVNRNENGIGYGFEEIHLKKGDFLLIKKHQKHRIAYTSKDPTCIWLCLFINMDSDETAP